MKTRLESVDILRGIAAIGVFLFHVCVSAGFDKRTLPPFELLGRSFHSIPNLFSLGSSGVNLFFVVSGFCLALQRVGKPQRTFSGGELRSYWQNRLARVVPAYWLTVLLAAALAMVSGRVDRESVGSDVLLHMLFLHGCNPRTFLGIHGGLWSMATEVQFYLVFPLLLVVWDRLGTRWFAISTALVTLAFRIAAAALPVTDPAAGVSSSVLLSYQLPGRLSEFCLGIVVAELYRKRSNGTRAWPFGVAVLALLPPTLWIRARGPQSLADLSLGLMYACILATVVLADQSRKSWWRSLGAAFGRSSYSFFLLHYLVLAALALGGPSLEMPWTRALFLAGVGLPISILAGVLFYNAIEVPFWRWLRSDPAKRQPGADPVAS